MVELIYFTFKVPYSFKLQAEDSFRAPGRFLRLPHRVVFRVAERKTSKIHDRVSVCGIVYKRVHI